MGRGVEASQQRECPGWGHGAATISGGVPRPWGHGAAWEQAPVGPTLPCPCCLSGLLLGPSPQNLPSSACRASFSGRKVVWWCGDPFQLLLVIPPQLPLWEGTLGRVVPRAVLVHPLSPGLSTTCRVETTLDSVCSLPPPPCSKQGVPFQAGEAIFTLLL